jgi:hypothetical protein
LVHIFLPDAQRRVIHIRSGVPIHTSHSLGLVNKVLKSLGPRQVRHAEAAVVERRGQRLSRVGVLDIGPVNRGVDCGNDTAELRGGREIRVAADGRDVLGEGVEVLLGSDKSRGAGNDFGIVAERSNNLVSKFKLKM